MTRLFSVALLTWLFLGISVSAFCQASTDTIPQLERVIIKMANGDEFRGEILSRNDSIIVLRTGIGDLSLKVARIQSITSDSYVGPFEFPNPHDTRYFFGPTGIPLGKGEGYYQNILVAANFFNYGITNTISIGGGFEFISTLSGMPIWFLTPKAGFRLSDNLHAGGGLLLAGFASEGAVALPYGVVTLGSRETNASLGIGYGFADGAFSRYPAITFSGMHRAGKNISLLSENYLFPGSFEDFGYLGIQGIRLLGKKNAFDIGIILVSSLNDSIGIPALPYVGYVRIF